MNRIFLGELFGVAIEKPIDKNSITQLANIFLELVAQIMETENKDISSATDDINKIILDFASKLKPIDASAFIDLLEAELSTRSDELINDHAAIMSPEEKWNFYIRFKVSEPLGVEFDSFKIDKYTITPERDNSLKDGDVLILSNADSLVYREIAQESKKVEQALILAFAEIGIGIAYPENLASEAIIEKIKTEFENDFWQKNIEVFDSHYEIPSLHFIDKFGINLFLENSSPWDRSTRAEKSAVDITTLNKKFKSHYADFQNIRIADQNFRKIEIATSILTTSIFEDSLINKIILSMTVIEVLSEKIARPANEQAILDHLVSALNELPDANTDTKVTLTQALNSIRFQTISKSCKNLVNDLLGKKDAKLFYKLYEYRSQLVHNGSLKGDRDKMFMIQREAHDLAKRVLNAYINQFTNPRPA